MAVSTFPGGLSAPSQRELLQTVTLDRAAETVVASEYNGVVLVSCRDTSLDELSKLRELDNVEFGTLVLHAEGLDIGQLAMGLGVTAMTMKRRLGNIYEKIEVSDEIEAASFIPIRDRRLMGLPPVGFTSRGGKTGDFNTSEKILFDLVASGHSYAKIAHAGQVRPQKLERLFENVCLTLGLSNDHYARGVQLRRVAGALKNLGIYSSTLAEYANEVQPAVVDVIEAERLKKDGEQSSSSLRSLIVSEFSNNPGLRALTPNGHDPFQRVAWEIVYREIDYAKRSTESS